MIPPRQFHEIAFEELEKHPLDELRKLYEALNLPDFRVAESEVKGYLARLGFYRKNQFPDLSPDLYTRIDYMCASAIKEWDYARPCESFVPKKIFFDPHVT